MLPDFQYFAQFSTFCTIFNIFFFRPVCLFGATFSSVSLLLSAAAPTLPILYLTFGILLGASLRSAATCLVRFPNPLATVGSWGT